MARPREFNEDDVLRRAMHVFWRQGYEGTSISDLMEAMGLTKSSIYKAFGSKQGLFRRVVDCYQSDFLCFRREALAEATPRQIVERLLYGVTDLHNGLLTPPGCLETNAAVACSSDADPIRKEMIRNRESFESELRDRLQATATAGSLPAGMTSDDAAALVVALIQGLAVQAKAGVSQDMSCRIVRAALLSWADC